MSNSKPHISYQVGLPNPTSHLFEVTLNITNWQESLLDLKFPVWTPGSYLVREYSKHLQNFQARNAQQEELVYSRISKNHWQVQTQANSSIIISYQIYANELTVRTNHLDATHGYFNGAALFFFVPGLEDEPIELIITPPFEDWVVSTSLPRLDNQSNRFLAPDFDTLVDSPVEIGTHSIYDFSVLDKPHQLAVWGEGNLQPARLIEDISKIIQTQAKLFGGLPYERYLFLLHLSANGYGGLEHKDSCSLLYSRFSFRNQEKYQNFLQLVAHEFFHLWNVKRIRPQALEKYDYEQENYTTSLWFSEGATSYYDILIPYWAGIYPAKVMLDKLSKDLTRYLNTPGRRVQSATEASFDAWIKLYRRDANSDNSQISYYLKGQMICFVLDLLIRERHHNQRSFNDVLRELWSQFGKNGFSEQQLQTIIENIAQINLSEFFGLYVAGVEEIPFQQSLEPFGLLLKAEENQKIPYLGLRLQSEAGRDIVKFVTMNSPAQIGGINPEDEILAIDGYRITTDQLSERLQDYQANDIIEITVFHQDELRKLKIQLGEPQPSRYELVQIQSPTEYQKQNLLGWLE
jgi:predicted metalloprotease with PDZ domain